LTPSWSQLDLANEAGVRQALIGSIEHGRANPTLESLDKVASALDVAVADLLA
jgi:transcriptional regulator with XRE-family HTH domain